MNTKKTLMDTAYEYMVYYLNGERYTSSTVRNGKRIYEIVGKDRYLYAENRKGTKIIRDNRIIEQLDIGIDNYEGLLYILEQIGIVNRLMVSCIYQKHERCFLQERMDITEDVHVELNVTYELSGRIIPISRHVKTNVLEIKSTLYKIAKEICKQYQEILKLKKMDIRAAKYDVILCAGQGGILIHEGIGHNLEADIFFKENSLLNGTMNKKIFNEQINIYDTCTEEDFITYKISADGTEVRNINLVKNGTINQLISDMYTSDCYNIQDTGSGRAATYENIILPRMRNTYLQNGTIHPDSILHAMPNGIIALELGGGSVDIVSGQFVFNIALGGYVRNGEIIALLPQCIVKGNVLNALNHICEIGNDLKFKFAKCLKEGQEVQVSYGCPTIHVEGQQVLA